MTWTFRIEYTTDKLEDDCIQADFNFFSAQMKYDLYKTLNKLKGDRGRALRMVMKLTGAMQDATSKLFGMKIDVKPEDVMRNMQLVNPYLSCLIETKIHKENNATIIELVFDDLYFSFMEQANNRATELLMRGKNLASKKGIKENIEKELKKAYTTSFKLTEE